MMTFLIQSDKNKYPIQDFGDTVIRTVNEANWLFNYKKYDFTLTERINDTVLNSNYVPVGSVEFCLEWYKNMGTNIHPLNIPKELWQFVKHKIFTGKLLPSNGGYWMVKDIGVIKHPDNGYKQSYNGDEKFFSEVVQDVVSEWRLFVSRGRIVGCQCYLGDFWMHPDKDYCNSIVSSYDNQAYTLDVMVSRSRGTDILELHDFFSCGLYGFAHAKYLPLMLCDTQRKLLGGSIND